jgi:hypothetical protein
MPAYFILGVYALIGFLPYNYAYPFEGHGGLSVLAHPRLFLLFAMFIGCVYCIAYSRPSDQRGLSDQRGVRIQDAVPPGFVRD